MTETWESKLTFSINILDPSICVHSKLVLDEDYIFVVVLK